MKESGIELVNFAVGLPKKMRFGNEKIETGICNESIEGAYLAKEGFQGDGVADLKNHGGEERAVCVYPYEHYPLWEKEFQTSLPSAAFGENITATNMLEKDVCIGDIYQLGEAVIQVTQGRIPCSTISKRANTPHLLKRIIETGYTGFFCCVLEEGQVYKDSKVTLLQPHPKRVSILYGNQIYFHNQKDVEGMERLLDVRELAKDWRKKLEGRLKKQT